RARYSVTPNPKADKVVECLSTSLSGSRSNWLNPFAFPISCRQILARFRTLPTALHRDHTPELALGTPVPTRRAAPQAFEAWGASPFSRMSLLLRQQVSDCRVFRAGLEGAYRSDLSFWYSRDHREVVSTRGLSLQTAAPAK